MEKNITNKTAETKLKVALFPYLLDSVDDNYQSLFRLIVNEFKKVSPDIVLELCPFNSSGNFFDFDTLSKWLKDNGTGYDIVEIDCILLGDLIDARLIAPQLIDPTIRADWHSAAFDAAQFNQAFYGFPHLMCTYFLFTRDERVSMAGTIDQLVAALGSEPTNDNRLIGNLDSNWDLPCLWIDNYQSNETSTRESMAFALHGYTNDSFQIMRKLVDLCNRTGGENHCLHGTFKANQDMLNSLFAHNETIAMFGYSERLCPF